MAPVIELIPLGHIYMADRYAYVPYIWLFIMIANALGLLIRGTTSRVTVAVVAMVAVTLLTCASMRQLATWKNTVTVFTRALAIDPNNPIAHANLAVGYSLGKNHQQAIQHIEVALKLDPNNVVEKKIAAETYLRAGQPVRAVQYYQRVHDICQSPDNTASLAQLLSTNPKVRNPEAALRLARQAVALEPSAPNWDLFATALAACGKFEEAARIENRALSSGDSLPVYWEHLSTFQDHKMITVE
jgi:tetratricopeptide (TPR) repeat protein